MNDDDEERAKNRKKLGINEHRMSCFTPRNRKKKQIEYLI